MRAQLASKDIRDDAITYWQEVASDLFIPLACVNSSGSKFAWKFEAQDIGKLRLVDLAASPHNVSHTKEHVAKSPEPFFIVSQQVAGRGKLVQDKREADLNVGDFVFHDTTRPYEHRFSGPFRQRIIRIPHRLMEGKLSHTERVTARSIGATSALGSICTNFITNTFTLSGKVDSFAAQTVSNALTDLLAAALRECDSETRLDEAVNTRVLRKRILQYIESNISDPDLNVGRIASALGLSKRYVHLLMAESSTTPSEAIWSQRLERCAHSLSRASNKDVPISQIAFNWGYSDAAHFSRSFKLHYGLSPREFRHRALLGE